MSNPAATPQPPPTPGGEIVLHQVIEDLNARAEQGYQKYGTYLTTHNGRQALWDLYQELLDSCMYTKQHIMEQEDETLILCRVYALLAKAPHPDKEDIAESVNLLSRVLRQKNASGVELNSLPTPDQTLPANHAKQLALSAVGPNDATHNTAIAYVASQVQEKQNARNAE